MSRELTPAQARPVTRRCYSPKSAPESASDATEVTGLMFEYSSRPGASLRNRTVDLLLTIDRQEVAQLAVQALSRQNAGGDKQPLAAGCPREHCLAPQSAPQLTFMRRPQRARDHIRNHIRNLLQCLAIPVAYCDRYRAQTVRLQRPAS